MFGLAVSNCDNEVFTSQISAKRHWSVTNSDTSHSSSSSVDGIFHRAMSRRRTLEEDEDEYLCELFPVEENEMSSEIVCLTHDSSVVDEISSKVASNRWVSSELCSEQTTLNSTKKATSYSESNDVTVEVVAIDKNGVSKLEWRTSSYFRHNPYKQRYTRRIKSANDKPETITVYPGNQRISELSLPDWQEKNEPAEEIPASVRRSTLQAAPSPVDSPLASPPASPTHPNPSSSSSTETPYSDLIPGYEASIGRNNSMTLSNASDEVIGVETTLGPSRPMTPEDDNRRLAPTSSHGCNRDEPERPKKKRSVKDVFKKGLFLSKKNKKKDAIPPSTGSEIPQTSRPLRPKVYKRQQSRLDMNEPIEDVFAGVQFATIEKNPTPRPDSPDDSDVIEDPDVFALSTMLERQSNSLDNSRQVEANDRLTYDDVLSSNGRRSESIDLT